MIMTDRRSRGTDYVAVAFHALVLPLQQPSPSLVQSLRGSALVTSGNTVTVALQVMDGR